jgi:hypothetical protein
MAINGLLTKVIFDKNPDHEFYVEESFPLDWMYPYLTPFGIIMKINRQPLAEITEDVVKKDHDKIKPYGDHWDDGKMQFSFTLPVAPGELAATFASSSSADGCLAP